MAFGYYGRNAQEVQMDNRQYYNFAKIKERYENTKPLKGKRLSLNIRPHGERDRSWERIVKVNENEYYLTNDAYRFYETHKDSGRTHQRLMSFKLVGDTEYFTLHTPTANWYGKTDPRNGRLFPRSMSSPSWFWFAHYNMPSGLNFENIRSRKYILCEDKYFSAEKGDITFTRTGVTDIWKPLVVHREVIHQLDKEKTKALKEQAKDFLEYARVMSGLVDKQWSWDKRIKDSEDYSWEDLIKLNDDGSTPEDWLEMVQHYKHTASTYYDGFCEKRMRKQILNTLYALAKPCKEIEIPLGQTCYDKYRGWY